jgi:PhoPQ-activated pathogenicity-related protein
VGCWIVVALPSAYAQTRPLFDYVAKVDDSYSWTYVDSTQFGGTEIAELLLTSQTWRGKHWKHQLFLIKPERIATGTQALLIIGGGRWREALDDPQRLSDLPKEAELFASLAEYLETVVVVIAQVPFQPLFDRSEDQLIAYTFDKYLRSGNSEWPLLLPMVKSAVRAMDTGQAAAKALWNIELGHYTVVGGSKRGWTTWLAAAVDDRVTAIAPLVFDALNMSEHFPHQSEVWGAPSERIRPYTDLNLHNVLSTEDGRKLREIVDPYSYLDRLRIPKLVVNATNDEFFPLDSVNLYWTALEGERYALYLPNSGHSTDEFERLFASLNALHRQAAGLDTMPQPRWNYALEDGAVRLCATADPLPSAVMVWTARSEDRDFRDEHWEETALPRNGAAYDYETGQPTAGFLGLFAELYFGEGDAAYTLTTTPAVVGPVTDENTAWSAVNQGDACPATGAN